MAAAELLAPGDTAANSSDIVIADGAHVLVGLKAYVFNAEVIITLKDDDDAYNEVGRLKAQFAAVTLSGPGTFRVTRVVGAQCGVFSA